MEIFWWWLVGQPFRWDNCICFFFFLGEKLDLGLIAMLWWNFGPWLVWWVRVIRVFMGFLVKEMKMFLLVFLATKHWVKESKSRWDYMGCPFDILATKLGMKKIYGLYFWFSWLPNTEWGRPMWLFLWIFLATKHKTINNFILRKNLRKSLVWCWWNMKWCGVNVSLAVIVVFL